MHQCKWNRKRLSMEDGWAATWELASMDRERELWLSEHGYCFVQDVLGVKGALILCDLRMLKSWNTTKDTRLFQEYYILQLLPNDKKSHTKNSPARFQVTPSSLPKNSLRSVLYKHKANPEPRRTRGGEGRRRVPTERTQRSHSTQSSHSTQRGARCPLPAPSAQAGCARSPRQGPASPQRRRPAGCYQASAQPIPGPGEHKMAFELPTSNFLLFLEYTQCNAVCLSAMRHKGTAILWLDRTRTEMPGGAAFPSPFAGYRGLPRAAEEEELPRAPLDTGAQPFLLGSLVPPPPRTKSSVWNYIFIKWLPRSSEPCWAEPAAQPAAPCPREPLPSQSRSSDQHGLRPSLL